LAATLAIAVPAAGAGTHGEAPGPRLHAVTDALDAVLACERPSGGWTYVCERGVRTWGATRIINTAERIAGPLGLANWDLVVMRSPGTPAAGLLLLHGYALSTRPAYLAAAVRTGELLLNTQLGSGGWFSEMPVHGDKLAGWFRLVAPWTTLDDDVTPGAARFLLALWRTTDDARYRRAAERALDLLLRTQLSSGAWPLTSRPTVLRWLSPSFEDLPSMNDAATPGAIAALLAGAETLGRPDLLAAARRGADWIAAVRAPPPNAGWAQQYDIDGHPAPGRRFEPAGLASWESRQAVETLLALADATGDTRYCAPVPDTLLWLARSTVRPGCWARYYDPATGRPFYASADGKRVENLAQARRGYAWLGDFGIPALFWRLGVVVPGEQPAPAGAPPRNRLPGDSGVCPGETSSEEKLDSYLSRSRIAGAGVILAAAEPSLRARVCTTALAGNHRNQENAESPSE
jgi:hypothetical protein